jgi:hypothetical protein
MWAIIKQNVVRPGLERLGTVAAVWLVTGGEWMCDKFQACGLVTPDGATQVVAYVTAVALLCIDLVVIAYNRSKAGK